MTLTEDFILETFRICLHSSNMFAVCNQHMNSTYLPHRKYKEVWQAIKNSYVTLDMQPSVGSLSEKYAFDNEVLSTLTSIKEARLLEVNDFLFVFEEFIKRAMFVSAYDDMASKFQEEDKNKAYETMLKYGEKIANFSLREKKYEKIYEGFVPRFEARKNTDSQQLKRLLYGIHPLDQITGGLNEGDIALFLAQSGVGKTRLLRHIGVAAARAGYTVLHVQAEGSKEEVESGYDATWTSSHLADILRCNFSPDQIEILTQNAEAVMSKGGEIVVDAIEEFDMANMGDVRDTVEDLLKRFDKVDLVLLDYFELFDPPGNYNWRPSEERFRRDAIAKSIKNLAVKYKTRVVTATQGGTVSPELLNDPEFVQTRFHLSEFKGAVKPFTLFASLNQTIDEYEQGMMRIHVGKLRNNLAKQTFPIAQDYGRNQFYNHTQSMRYYQELYNQF